MPDISEKELQQLIAEFPARLDMAISDWAALNLGVKEKLFTWQQVKQATDWFWKFPDMWAGIRENITDSELRQRADLFADNLRPNWAKRIKEKLGLSLFPLIIAGIVLLVGSVIGVSVLISYWKKQQNIHDLISGVVSGKIPPEILAAAVAQEKQNLVTDVSALLSKLMVVGGLIYVGPIIINIIKGKLGAKKGH